MLNSFWKRYFPRDQFTRVVENVHFGTFSSPTPTPAKKYLSPLRGDLRRSPGEHFYSK